MSDSLDYEALLASSEFSPPSNNHLTLLHSLGYECRRHYNLCVPDEHSLLFCSGRLLHIYNIPENRVYTRPSDGNVCLGFVTKNPTEPHIAVGEKGPNPSIIIYCWPTFDVVKRLADGTSTGYVFLTFSPDGKVLCAQGAGPDYSITLWDWAVGTITAKATAPHTLRVQFSSFSYNCLVSCGDEGLYFWRLTNTYTGMKLIKERGHFNILEECQILSIYIMPDGRVVSGCAWGNILVWENSRVIMETCQRNSQACHDAPVINFTYNQQKDELCSVGMDGWIKMWHYGRFKLDPNSDEIKVLIKPIFEIKICDVRGLSILSYILKKNADQTDSTWFGQDKNGSLWQIDMQVSAMVSPPMRLYTTHTGAVAAVAASPHSLRFASLAENGVLHIYEFITGKLTALSEFSVGGSKLVWLPIMTSSGGEMFAAGFMDGSIRIIILTSSGLSVSQESKPHRAAVTDVIVSRDTTLLVSGSEDQTVFIYKLQNNGQLNPVGFVELSSPVRCLAWNPLQEKVILVCCKSFLNEIVIPESVFTGISYKLAPTINTVCVTKSDGVNLDNLLYSVYENSSLLCLVDDRTLYKYSWETKTILKQTPLEKEISSVHSTKDMEMWLIGFKSGDLRTWLKKDSEWFSEKDYEDILLHDSEFEGIADICISCDNRFVVACGRDANLFVYVVRLQPSPASQVQPAFCEKATSEEMEDVQEEPGVSLEEAKKESVFREKLAVSMMKKVRAQKQLVTLRSRYLNIVKRNRSLPESQTLPHSDFCLDKRLQNHIKKMLDAEMKTVKQRLNFDVEKSLLKLHKLKGFFINCLAAYYIEISALRSNKSVATFVHRNLGIDFEEGESKVTSLIESLKQKTRTSGSEVTQKTAVDTTAVLTVEVDTEESYLRSVQDIYSKLSNKIKRALEKHKLTKQRKEERKKQWQVFLATQPDPEKNLPSDVAAIENAARTVGDYKLKQSRDFKLPDQTQNTSLYKLGQLVEAKRKIFSVKERFNDKIYCLRAQKVELERTMRDLEAQLLDLHRELPTESRIQPPLTPKLNVAREFPERQFQINPEKEPGTTPVSSLEREHIDEFFILQEEPSDDKTESSEDTLWESQIRAVRKTKQLFKQNQILEEMERLLTGFDTRVDELSVERLQLSTDIKYLESFVNLLHQELHIIHSYDETETAILEKVNYSLAEKHTKHLKINILQHKIDTRVAEVTLLEEKLEALEKSFTEMTAANRVVRHLTRIFNKKYRPLILSRDNEEGSDNETSSEDTSEDSDSTIHVGKPSPRRADHKCPVECDQDIHKTTLELRAKRHQIEAKIITEKMAVDQMSREKERNYKFLKLIEPVLRMNQDKLDKLQKEKQMKLNETEVLVILNCGQICGRSLLMSKNELDKLRARVSELQRQTEHHQEKLRKSQRYQQRFAEAFSSMETKTAQLNKDIDKAMICKFGQHVDLEVLEEKILERTVKKTRQSLREEELHKKYEKIIKDLKEELLEKSEDLADLMRVNTHKLQMLSSLEEEKQKLLALSVRVNKANAEANEREMEYTEDIYKLKQILQNLILQKETVIHEIKVLSLKGRPLPPIISTNNERTKSSTIQSQSRDSDDVASFATLGKGILSREIMEKEEPEKTRPCFADMLLFKDTVDQESESSQGNQEEEEEGDDDDDEEDEANEP